MWARIGERSKNSLDRSHHVGCTSISAEVGRCGTGVRPDGSCVEHLASVEFGHGLACP